MSAVWLRSLKSYNGGAEILVSSNSIPRPPILWCLELQLSYRREHISCHGCSLATFRLVFQEVVVQAQNIDQPRQGW